MQNLYKPKFTYVIPFRYSQDRILPLRRVVEWLSGYQGVEVLIVEQDKVSYFLFIKHHKCSRIQVEILLFKEYPMIKKLLIIGCLLVLPTLAGCSQNATTKIEATQTSQTSTNQVTVSTNTTGIPLNLPTGFSASIYAKDLGGPRVMLWGPDGAMLVSLTSKGKVVALMDKNNSGMADTVVTVAENLNNPHGLATRCDGDRCSLYIAESDKVSIFDYDKTTHKATNGKKLVDLPSGSGHFTRTIMFLPAPDQDTMLISIGSGCNVCHEDNPVRASIYSMKADGSDFKLYSKGIILKNEKTRFYAYSANNKHTE